MLFRALVGLEKIHIKSHKRMVLYKHAGQTYVGSIRGLTQELLS